ncbi:hypothetical protein TNCV_5031261 [Trichonephila clavipes]|nr:hypothetical protein TNCV_5031261 [Trichonephila clavipes]
MGFSGSLATHNRSKQATHANLYVFNEGIMNSQKYQDKILDQHVKPCAADIDDNFILKDDNAQPHQAMVVH